MNGDQVHISDVADRVVHAAEHVRTTSMAPANIAQIPQNWVWLTGLAKRPSTTSTSFVFAFARLVTAAHPRGSSASYSRRFIPLPLGLVDICAEFMNLVCVCVEI